MMFNFGTAQETQTREPDVLNNNPVETKVSAEIKAGHEDLDGWVRLHAKNYIISNIYTPKPIENAEDMNSIDTLINDGYSIDAEVLRDNSVIPTLHLQQRWHLSGAMSIVGSMIPDVEKKLKQAPSDSREKQNLTQDLENKIILAKAHEALFADIDVLLEEENAPTLLSKAEQVINDIKPDVYREIIKTLEQYASKLEFGTTLRASYESKIFTLERQLDEIYGIVKAEDELPVFTPAVAQESEYVPNPMLKEHKIRKRKEVFTRLGTAGISLVQKAFAYGR